MNRKLSMKTQTKTPSQGVQNMEKLTLVKAVGLLSGIVGVFYALGFAVVQSYVYKNGFEGLFWFTNEFYRDAGANFLLEIVRTPLLAPHIFLPYLFVLLLLLPKTESLIEQKKEDAVMSPRQWIKMGVLASIVIAVYFSVLYFDYYRDSVFFSNLIDDIFMGDSEFYLIHTKRSLFFFCLTIPLAISLSVFLHRFRDCLKAGSRSRAAYGMIFIAYLIFLTIVPIAFGLHLYDLKLVAVKEPQSLPGYTEKVTDSSSSYKVWLLGEFRNKYIFFTKPGYMKQGVIEMFDIDQIKKLRLDPSRAESLRTQMADTSSYLPGSEKIVLDDVPNTNSKN